MHFHEKLTELRKREGLSQDELGERLGVSRQTISKWELGQSYPDFKKLVAVSDYFHLSLDELVKDVDGQEGHEPSSGEKLTAQISEDLQTAKSVGKKFFTVLAVLGVAGILFFLLIGILYRV